MKKVILPVIIFVVALGLYTWMLNPMVAAEGDSGELVTVAYTLGIAHPPGYPLYTLVGHVFSLLPINSVGWRLNLLAAIAHSLTLVFFFLTVKKLTNSVGAAVIGTAALAFSYTFWLYSLIAEVFSLNDFLVMVVIYVTLTIESKSKVNDIVRKLVLIAFVVGLGMANHQSIALILPAVALWLWQVRRPLLRLPWQEKFRLGLFLVLSGGIGLTLYAYFLIRARMAVFPVAWSYPATLKDVWAMFIRSDYGTLSATAGSNPALVTAVQKADQLWTYLSFLKDDFLIFGLVAVGVGLVWGFFRSRRVLIFLLTGFFISGVFFLAYANFPVTEGSGTGLEITERFYLLPNIFVALLASLGFAAVIAWTRGKFALRYLAIPLLTVYILWLFWGHVNLVNQRGNFLGWQLGKDILDSAPRGALVYPVGDVPTFVAFYARYVEGYRPDLEVITPNVIGPNNQFRYLLSRRSNLAAVLPRTASFSGVIAATVDSDPIYYSAYFGYRLPPSADFVASPSGFLTHLVRRAKVQSFDQWYQGSESVVSTYASMQPGWADNIKTTGDFAVQSNYFFMYYSLGTYCSLAGHLDCAAQYFNLAKGIDPSRIEAYIGLAQVAQLAGRCDEAERDYLYVLRLNPGVGETYEQLYLLARDCFKDQAKANEYDRQRRSFEQVSGGSLKNL